MQDPKTSLHELEFFQRFDSPDSNVHIDCFLPSVVVFFKKQYR